MGIGTYLNEVRKAFTEYIDRKTTSKKALVANITTTIGWLGTTASLLQSLTPSERSRFKNEFDNLSYDYSGYISGIVKRYNKALTKGAAAIERDKPFGAIQESVINMRRTLEQALNEIDTYFGEDDIMIDKIKISQAMFFSVLQSATVLAKGANYFLAIALKVAAAKESKANIDKYQIIFFEKHFDEFMDIVNAVAEMSGKYTFMSEVHDVKHKANMDFDLMTAAESPASTISNLISSVAHMKLFGLRSNNVSTMVAGFNPITTIGETWIGIQHALNARNKYLKEWAEQRVALLKLDLSGNADPKERERLEKIIENYEELITKLNRKIAKYEED
jgi:hypothetical protein